VILYKVGVPTEILLVVDCGDWQALSAVAVIVPLPLLTTVAVVVAPVVGDTLRLPVADQEKLVAFAAVAVML